MCIYIFFEGKLTIPLIIYHSIIKHTAKFTIKDLNITKYILECNEFFTHYLDSAYYMQYAVCDMQYY